MKKFRKANSGPNTIGFQPIPRDLRLTPQACFRLFLALAPRVALLFRGLNPRDTSLRLPFGSKRSILAGLLKFLAVGCGLNEITPLANRVIDFSDITTLYKNRLAPPRPQGFGWGRATV